MFEDINKSSVVGAVLAVIILIAGGFYITRVLPAPTAQEDQAAQESAEDQQATDDKKDDVAFGGAQITPDEAYALEIEVTNSDDITSTTKIEYDGSGNSHTTFDTSDGIKETITIGNDYYMLDSASNTWSKFSTEPDGDVAPGTNTGYSKEALEKIDEGSISDKGTDECETGICRVYEITEGETITEVQVDDKTNRILLVATTQEDGTKIRVSYIYDTEITIEAPSDFEEAPTNL